MSSESTSFKNHSPHANGVAYPSEDAQLELIGLFDGDCVSELVDKNVTMEEASTVLSGKKVHKSQPSRGVSDCSSGSDTLSRFFCHRWFAVVMKARYVLFGSKIKFLLPAVIISVPAVTLKWGQGWIFLFSLLGIAPLAERLGFVTEQLAVFTGPTDSILCCHWMDHENSNGLRLPNF